MLVNKNLKKYNAVDISFLWIKSVRTVIIRQKKTVKLYMFSDTLSGNNFHGKYVLHCSGIDPFVTLMGNLT